MWLSPFGFHTAFSAILLLVISAVVGLSQYWCASYFWNRYDMPLAALQPWIGIIVMAFLFLCGFLILEYCRYLTRAWARLTLLVFLWLLFIIRIHFPDSQEFADFIRQTAKIGMQNPWPFVTVVLAMVFRRQFIAMFSGLNRAEVAGVKLEIDRLDKIQKSLNPWKRTVTDFGEMMDWVCDLIEQTPPDDIVRFLAYTPALGYLTRTEREWQRLYELLISRPNIQFICLEEEELRVWHSTFIGKRTKRPEGAISPEMADRSSQLAKFILAGQKRLSEPCNRPVELQWSQMPGYYLFSNRKRAIIATPIFFAINPLDYAPRDKKASSRPVQAAGSDADADLHFPVEMLGFESEDSWTVWLAGEVCQRLSRHANGAQPKRKIELTPAIAEAETGPAGAKAATPGSGSH